MFFIKLYLLYPIVTWLRIQISANKCWYITILTFVPIVTGFKKNKKTFLNFIQKMVYKGMIAQLWYNSLYFLIIFCILTLFCLGTILVILVYFLQECMLIAYEFTSRHLKLLKQKIFTAH